MVTLSPLPSGMKDWTWRMSGLLYGREKACVCFTHQAKKAVWLSRKKTLPSYFKQNKKYSGIIVARFFNNT